MTERVETIIVGAGFSGLCMGIKLKKAGLNDFLILEKADDLGGTWRENTYPGAECDIPSALYSFSFEHNSKWEYKWSGQAQILKYQHDTANKYRLREHLRFNEELSSAKFDQATGLWTINTRSGAQFIAAHFISAVGQLHHPSMPSFAGQETYSGHTFHSAEWDHSLDLSGLRVAVIGNAASAVQFIPKIAEQTAHLTIFQRSPNWVLPKQDRPYTRIEQWLSEKIPLITKFYRLNLWLKGELGILPAIRGNRVSRWLLRTLSQNALKKSINDEALRAKLTPEYPVGAKRVLFADEYYPSLARDNVYLDTTGIERFTEQGIVRNDGVEEKFDVIIFATGFKTNPFLVSMDIVGLDGRSLHQHWQNGAHAFLGVSTHGFPNLHIMYGPNTNLGHNSIIIMIEAQAAYIVQAIEMSSNTAMQVKEDVEQKFNAELQTRLAATAFGAVADSWYLDNGKITNNWAGGTLEYKRRLKTIDQAAYQPVTIGT